MRIKMIVLHRVCTFHSLLGGKRWSREEIMGKTRVVRHWQRLLRSLRSPLTHPIPWFHSVIPKKRDLGSNRAPQLSSAPFLTKYGIKSSPSPDSVHLIYTWFTPDLPRIHHGSDLILIPELQNDWKMEIWSISNVEICQGIRIWDQHYFSQLTPQPKLCFPGEFFIFHIIHEPFPAKSSGRRDFSSA